MLCLKLASFLLSGCIICINASDPAEGKIHAFSSSEHDHVELGEPVDLPVPVMIKNAGYPVEIHHVTTSDGYILEMHRIPSGSVFIQNPISKRPVIFLQHGLLGSSADWILNIPEKALAFMLADHGYDVWMGNARGNTYSRNHTKYSIHSKTFWSFSWDQMGQYDLPAELNYVCSLTSQEKIYYIGHSMGTTMFWVMMNHHPEMNQNITLMFALGPVAYVGNMISPIRLLAPFVNEMELMFRLLGDYEFLPSGRLMKLFAHYVCDEVVEEEELCENFIFLITGFDSKQLNKTALPVILGHTPAGTSTFTVMQFAQEVNTNEFQYFNFGTMGNWKHYGQATPPLYNISMVQTPVVLMYAHNDWLADPKDVKQLSKGLPNVILNYEIPIHKWNHLDFLWGMNADEYVYKKIFEILPHF